MRTVGRWALWAEGTGFYRPLPLQTEALFESRRAAVAARLSGSLYRYRPVKVALLFPVGPYVDPRLGNGTNKGLKMRRV